jgi:diketogulonate reductase-like aldo/keto reductase
VKDVHTAIVGTANPDRYQQNAALISAGNLSDEEYQAIRAIWEQRADQHWLTLD